VKSLQDNPSLGNYIMLGISNNGYFEYRYELGSGEVNITSAQPIEIGSVYNITVLRLEPVILTVMYLYYSIELTIKAESYYQIKALLMEKDMLCVNN
jgi:hypothetical protein